MNNPNGMFRKTGDAVKITLQWLRWADSDYLAARIALLGALVPQGAILCNTTIEKYLKALLWHIGAKIPHSHRVCDLFGTIKKQVPINLAINESYLRLLQKSYQLRYPDDLTEGFNIALNQARLLVELDRTVQKLTERFLIRENEKRLPLILERSKGKKDERIIMNNVVFDVSLNVTLFAMHSRSYDLRIWNGAPLEAEYTTISLHDEADFEREGWPLVDGSFHVAYEPVFDDPNPG